MASIIAFFIGKLLENLMLIQVVPRLSAALSSILALELGPRSMLSAGLKVPWVDIARLGFA